MSYNPGACVPRSHAAARSAPAAKVSRLVARWTSSTRSPASAKRTVCSPTTSPPRTACRPISFLRALADQALPAVAGSPRRIAEPAHIGQDFCEPASGAAGRVLLEPVMHLDDFEVEAGAEDLRAACRVSQKSALTPTLKFGARMTGNHLGGPSNLAAGGLVVAGGADHEGFTFARRQQAASRPGQGGGAAEVDHGLSVRRWHAPKDPVARCPHVAATR